MVIPQTNVALAVADPGRRLMSQQSCAAADDNYQWRGGMASLDLRLAMQPTGTTAEWLILQPGINNVVCGGWGNWLCLIQSTEVWA